MIEDKSAATGMTNYFFVDKDESGEDYYYYLFQNNKGSILIMRTNTEGEEVKYHLSSKPTESGHDISTVFNNRSDYTYLYPQDLKDPTVG
jgi:hypothetical protein